MNDKKEYAYTTTAQVDWDNQTPLMRQYWELKLEAQTALLLFRMGDFYELFGEDARIAAPILNLTITSRDRKASEPLAMAGMPAHSVGSYVQKLLDHGYKVGIAEQMEPAHEQLKLVPRKIVRFFTPGIQFEGTGVEARYIASLLSDPRHKDHFVTALLDLATGDARIGEAQPFELVAPFIKDIGVRHILWIQSPTTVKISSWDWARGTFLESLPSNYISLEAAQTLLKKQLGCDTVAPYLQTPTEILAFAMVIKYGLRSQGQEIFHHLKRPEKLFQSQDMMLGSSTREHLNFQELFWVLNKTRTILGARRLKKWLFNPLKDLQSILHRQAMVQASAQLEPKTRTLCDPILKKIPDLERLLAKIAVDLASPQDIYTLAEGLIALQDLAQLLDNASHPLAKDLHVPSQLQTFTQSVIKFHKPNPPNTSSEGGIFELGYDAKLDEYLAFEAHAKAWLTEYELQQKASTGITSLKVKYNNIFGYFIEVTNSYLKLVPSTYERKQTMTGAERFTTLELKAFEHKALHASEAQKDLEKQLFTSHLILWKEQHLITCQHLADILAAFDFYYTGAQWLLEPYTCMPTLNLSRDYAIENSYHPLLMHQKGLVPNALNLNANQHQVVIITGPNMAGKSTFMRQMATHIIMGQIGYPVFAHQASWGVMSGIFSRVGAHDLLLHGQSTFMVEMSELASILHHADARAFIILDEIGRGTSTFDGMSVAWAALEWIVHKIGAKTLFSTHYHEITRCADHYPQIRNAHMAVEQNEQGLRFLYQLQDGPLHQSFGIHVAQMAGLPKPLIQRAFQILAFLQNSTQPDTKNPQPKASISAQPEQHLKAFKQHLRSLLQEERLNTISPLESLNILHGLAIELSKDDDSIQA